MTCPKGKGGRPAKTLREKQVLGVKHKSRLNRNPPDTIIDRIDKFENLGKIGKKIFELYEPMLYNNGTLSSTDAITLFMLCKKYEDWFEIIQKVEQSGRYIPSKTIEDDKGNITTYGMVIAPWAKLEKDAFNDLLKICREFGLTPVSRSGVDKIIRNKNENPFL